MKASWPVVLAALLGACSSLPIVADGIVALQVQVPTSLTLQQGDIVMMHAKALNAAGDSVDAQVTWLTPDTTITVTTAGVVQAVDSAGSGRVQAVVGTLHSDFITFTLARAASGTGSLRAR